jgi:hypothetical protein
MDAPRVPPDHPRPEFLGTDALRWHHARPVPRRSSGAARVGKARADPAPVHLRLADEVHREPGERENVSAPWAKEMTTLAPGG